MQWVCHQVSRSGHGRHGHILILGQQISFKYCREVQYEHKQLQSAVRLRVPGNRLLLWLTLHQGKRLLPCCGVLWKAISAVPARLE